MLGEAAKELLDVIAYLGGIMSFIFLILYVWANWSDWMSDDEDEEEEEDYR